MDIEWYHIAFLTYLCTAVTYSEQAIPTRPFSTDGIPLKKRKKKNTHKTKTKTKISK